MTLVHASELSSVPTSEPDFVIDCNSGHEMSKEIFSVKKFTEQTNTDEIVWDSAHYKILLWFKNKEMATLYGIKR